MLKVASSALGMGPAHATLWVRGQGKYYQTLFRHITRYHGLNTAEMLKVASSALGMGPAHAMQVRFMHPQVLATHNRMV